MTITVDQTGITAPSLDEARKEARARYTGIFGSDLTRSAQTPPEQLAGVDAVAESELGEAAISLMGLLDVDHTAGTMQDMLYGLVDVRRSQARLSVVTATLAGVEGTVVAARRRARTTAGADFRLLEDVVLTPAGVDTVLAATQPGPVRADAGTLTRIVTPVPGWETITNAQDAVLGQDREADADFAAYYRQRTGRLSTNSVACLRAALTEMRAGRFLADDNRQITTKNPATFPVFVRHLLVVAESGLDSDLERVIEGCRATGSGTMTAIRGGPANLGQLRAMANGSLVWDGVAYGGIDLTGAGTHAEVAALLTTALAAGGVAITSPDGATFLASYSWQPDASPNFGTSPLTTAAGLDPANSTYPAGPFLRPTERPLDVTFDLQARPGFPADGLAQVRAALLAVANGYPLGTEVWAGDLLGAVERIAGTRATNFSVQHGGRDVSGQPTPADTLWTLALGDIDITVT